MKNSYVRIGVQYFKQVEKPSVFGVGTMIRLPWNYDTLKRDHSVEFIGKIPKYDGEICVPDHLNLKFDINGFYNIYSPLTHQPAAGEYEQTMMFLKHIFGEQIEIGLDYLQILYTKPLQILPILCLVSKDRITGKSTFLKWLKLLFQRNATYLNNDSFNSNFNADWVNRLLIMLDEVLFNKEELTERIKNLSTANEFKLESKGVDRYDTDFFGKFILCSNNETGFIKIDPEEVRFWVLQIPKLQVENPEILTLLESEIPFFLNFLKIRTLSTEPLTRMWFTIAQIETKALLRLKMASSPKLNQEMAFALMDAMDFMESDSIKVVPNDILNLLGQTKLRASKIDIRKILKEVWCVLPNKNSFKYTRPILYNGGTYISQESKGRYFQIERKFLTDKFDDLLT